MTTDKLEATLSSLLDLRARLIDQWVEFMFLDDTPTIVEMRAAIVRDDDWAKVEEIRLRRAIVRLRARSSMQAGLADLIKRYEPPSWN